MSGRQSTGYVLVRSQQYDLRQLVRTRPARKPAGTRKRTILLIILRRFLIFLASGSLIYANSGLRTVIWVERGRVAKCALYRSPLPSLVVGKDYPLTIRYSLHCHMSMRKKSATRTVSLRLNCRLSNVELSIPIPLSPDS